MRSETETRHRNAIERVIRRMRREPASPLSLDLLADVACMSRFHFVRTFRAETRLSPGRFLAMLRIEHAKRLLLNTQHPVIAICHDSGYASVGTFTCLFTQYVGVSPSRLRALRDQMQVMSMPSHSEPGIQLPAGGLHSARVRGRVSALPGGADLVFVGLFRCNPPRGCPLGASVLYQGGDFSLPVATTPQGTLVAFAVPGATDACHYLLPSYGGTWFASAEVPQPAGQAMIELRLRPLSVFDPPTLFALPLLLGRSGPSVVAVPAFDPELRRRTA